MTDIQQAAKKMRLGDALIAEGLINEEQLQQALALQKKSGKRLGAVLVEMHLVTEHDIVQILSKQLKIPFIDLSNYLIDPVIAKLVPEHLAKRHMLIPINKVGNKLTVAMVDPLNIIAIDDIQLLTGLMVKPVVATQTDINKALQDAYGAVAQQDKLMGELDDIGKEEAGPDDLDQLGELGENDAPIIRLCNLVISQAVQNGVSDIHIEPFEKELRIRYRQDGMLFTAMTPPKKATAAITSRIKIMSSLNIAEKRLPQDGRIKIKVANRMIDLRVSVLPVIWGEKIVMRILDQSALRVNLEDLGFEPETLKRFKNGISSPYGIILVTGPTGSGKTTTLYSALTSLNRIEVNCMTAEDPVEYMLQGINQVHCKPEIGLTFAAALRAFLRQDPNIIMVGEIRDFETAEIAIKASMTGHLVLSTLHTNDAPGTIGRIVNMGIEPFMVTTSVLLVQAQRLVRKICKDCKFEIKPRAEQIAQFGITPELLRRLELPHINEKNMLFYKGKGCETCNNSGTKGRIGVYEVMVMSERLREIILNGGSTDDIRRQAIEEGMLSLRESALRKALTGITSLEEVVRVTMGEH
ncbi:MAG: Type IV fimbrial assembly, ATPase PilB [Candidatus Ozemobacter sibiricus]|jgi:type IV pilus assembly protein PilB|uniref:Type IV fimbrial assembly, ATPase PilB n=1 Tax=Candidatus Ozemobacter sibiricus TaxID=2268124 RepID=A0A367ZRB9_9BACT|nr:MAG: Type IV fimbrial assembly, ATPase PilB [Candidatus Ozemobacter sibiricus]